MSEDKIVDLTPDEMFRYREAALKAAIMSHGGRAEASEISHNAGVYLTFLLMGNPVAAVGTIVSAGGESTAAIPQPTSNAPIAPVVAAAKGAAAKAAAKRTPPAAAVVAAPAAPAAPAKPTTVAAPTNMTEAVASFKKLVADKTVPGRGRDVAIELLKEFKVEQLSQVPAPQLAEFKRRCDTAGADAPAPAAVVAADDPTGGLL